MKKLNLILVLLVLVCVCLPVSGALAAEPATKPDKAVTQLAEGMININNADLGTLSQLPGIGEKTAQKIIGYREKNGEFKAVEDLMKVKGIGEKKFNKLKKYLSVS